jgi:WD40 repeat protein
VKMAQNLSPEFHEISPDPPFQPELQAILEGSKSPIFNLDWSPDGHLLAWAGHGQIRLWDAINRQETDPKIQAHSGDIWGMAWSPDGNCLASASQDGSVKLWNTANWQKTADLDTGAWAFCISWSPDGKRLAVGTGSSTDETRPETFSGTSQIWDLDTQQMLRQFFVSSFIISTAWSPDGSTLAVGQWDGRITFWDGEKDSALKSLVATTARSDVNGLAWSPDGCRLGSAHQDGKIRVWDPGTGKIQTTFAAREGWLRGLAWSPDGSLLASAGEDGVIRIWRLSDGRMLAGVTPGSLPIWSLKWSPDGNWLAAGNGIFSPEPIPSQVAMIKMP